MKQSLRRFVVCCICALGAWPAWADLTLVKDAKSLALSEGLAIDGLSDWARRPINIDGVVAALVDGTLGDPAKNPKAGDTLPRPVGLRGEGKDAEATTAWHEVKGEVKGEGIAADGVFPAEMPKGTYLLFAVNSDRERVMMLEASGHGVAYVNGEPRVGDPYSFGFVRLPVLLHEGANQIILQHARRGEVKARLEEPESDVMINGGDLTLPDFTGSGTYELAVPFINTTNQTIQLTVAAQDTDLFVRAVTPVPDERIATWSFALPPLSVTKLPLTATVQPRPGEEPEVRIAAGTLDLNGRWHLLMSKSVKLRVADSASTHKRTYTSKIDRSVQYVSVVPPLSETGENAAAPGLVLSVHGASVEATGQAASYAAKKGLVIACPTNRRPYGFDWEDWGRIDGLEALDFVAKEFKTDPARQYLTGHSMGGHGTWQIGCLYPERFAAIAPSAGWLSFSTYMSAVGQRFGPVGDDPVMQKFRDVIAPSDTISLLPRLKGKGIYILHGDADDNVPVSEARRAREELTKLGIPFEFHEQPGAGHWWDDDAIKKSQAGEDGQTKWGAACVDWPDIFAMFEKHTLGGKNENVLPPSPLGADGFHPGSFKRVFNNNFVLVYGTRGSKEENAWAYAKARFDGEQWWYRGNGYARLMSDNDYMDKLEAGTAPSGNLVCYGDARIHGRMRAYEDGEWEPAFPSNEKLEAFAAAAPDRAWVYTAPAHGNPSRLEGVIGGNTLRAMRATDRLSYFSAGVDYPAVTEFSPEIWTKGEEGVLVAGFPKADGTVDPEKLAWRAKK